MIPQEMQNTIAFIIEQQAKFEENFTRAEQRFARVEKRLDRLEELAQRMMRAADARRPRDAERGEEPLGGQRGPDGRGVTRPGATPGTRGCPCPAIPV